MVDGGSGEGGVGGSRSYEMLFEPAHKVQQLHDAGNDPALLREGREWDDDSGQSAPREMRNARARVAALKNAIRLLSSEAVAQEMAVEARKRADAMKCLLEDDAFEFSVPYS